MGAEKYLHSKDSVTLRMRKAEDERKEERSILSYGKSKAGRDGRREEDGLIVLRKNRKSKEGKRRNV